MRKQIIGHRGAPRMAHENTLAGFQKAILLGVDMVELDVRETADGVLAVFHDKEISGRLIAQITFADLNRLAQKENFSVPTLENALEFLAGKTKVSIEIKEEGCELKTVDAATRFLKAENFEIISFNFKVLKTIRQGNRDITLKLILGNYFDRLGEVLKFLVNREKYLKVINGVCLNFQLVNFALTWFIPENIPITVWTIDSPKQLQKFLNNQRISFITTNRPDLALSLRKENGL